VDTEVQAMTIRVAVGLRNLTTASLGLSDEIKKTLVCIEKLAAYYPTKDPRCTTD
jgi:hypothetical protein